jgi:hypothetical protein
MTQASKFPGRPALRSVVIGPPAAAPDLIDTGQPGRTAERRQNNASARSLLEHYAGDIPVDQFNLLTNPTLGPAGTPVNLVSFQVPSGYVFEVRAVAITYHDQLIHQGDWVSWRFAVNNSRPPFIGAQGQEFNPGGFGRVTRPVEIGPIRVQAGQLAQLQIACFNANFITAQPYLVVSGRMQGVLRSTTSGAEVYL